jgi:hypothetical protein
MDQTPMDIFIMAIELTLTILVLGFIGSMMILGNQMVKSYQKEVDIANNMQEYASFSKYDDTSLSGSDAVEAIHMYASGDLVVTIKSPTTTQEFTDANVSLNSLVGGATPIIDLKKDYHAYIRFDTTGYVRKIIFSVNALSAGELNAL